MIHAVRIFLYEYITGGGCYRLEEPPADSLRAEGTAMVVALAADFAALEDVHLTVVRDRRWAGLVFPSGHIVEVGSAVEERGTLEQLAQTEDAGLIIAPELDGALTERTRWIEAAGGRLLSPDSDWIATAADKWAVHRQLARGGIRVPEARPLVVPADGMVDLPRDFPYPAVVKRRDGAGSVGMQLVSANGPGRIACEGRALHLPARSAGRPEWMGRDAVDHRRARCRLDPRADWIIEAFCPGVPVSVARICGPRTDLALPPCLQNLDRETFQYRGGIRLVDRWLSERATELAQRAIDTLGRPTGYVGVDLQLGADPAGRDDYVLDINPRITTSYVGLRALAEGNLASAIRDSAEGRKVTLCFRPDPLQFTAEGHVFSNGRNRPIC